MSFFTALLLVPCLQGQQAFDPRQRQALHDALYIANLSERDLKAEKDHELSNRFIEKIHQDPFPSIASFASAGKANAECIVSRLRKKYLEEDLVSRRAKIRAIEFPEDVPLAIRESLSLLCNAVLDANEEVRGALGGLSPTERRELIEGLPSHAVHGSLLSLDFVKNKPASWTTLLGHLAKADIKRLRNAAESLYGQVEKVIPTLTSVAPSSFQTKLRFAVDGVPVVLAGFGDDFHEDRDAGLTIDLGGNDRYSGRHGAGIGYASVQIDLDGSDTYTVPDLSLGVGLLGIGLAWDLGGEDVVRGKSICLGSGIAGVGMFLSRGRMNSRGEFGPDDGDLYECLSMGQGFGLYGIGALSDNGGNDVYRSKYLSQGSSLSGGIGALEDDAGRDRYFADGLAPSLESDSVLRSRSQGFGGRIGFSRDEPGGIGHLLDFEGRDVYVAGTEAQGCGLDGGLGLLVDSIEDDTYRIEGYGQGFGARNGVGALLEQQGTDEFICSHGAAQGVGADSGIGTLIDWSGADLHAMSTGSPGNATNGGLGVLLDFEGFDRYASTPLQQEVSLETRGIGLLLDLGGANQFAGTTVGQIGSVSGAWNIVAILESRRDTDTVSPPELKPVAAPITPDDIESTLAEASGLAAHATRVGKFQARANLAAFPRGIIVWLGEQTRPIQLAEAKILGEVFQSAPETDRSSLVRMVASSNDGAAKNALLILAETNIAESGSAILTALKNDKLAATAARAASALSLKESAAELMVLCASRDPAVRREASVALSKVGGPEAIATAQVLLANEDPVVRTAAVELIRRVGVTNLEPFKAQVASSSEHGARSTMQAISAIGTPEALNFLGSKLTDTRAGIRIEALRALNGRCPKPYRATFEARKEDQDSRVRIVASSLEPGR